MDKLLYHYYSRQKHSYIYVQMLIGLWVYMFLASITLQYLLQTKNNIKFRDHIYYFIVFLFSSHSNPNLCQIFIESVSQIVLINILYLRESQWKYFRLSYEWCRTVLSDGNTSFTIDDRCAASVIYNLNVNRFEQKLFHLNQMDGVFVVYWFQVKYIYCGSFEWSVSVRP